MYCIDSIVDKPEVACNINFNGSYACLLGAIEGTLSWPTLSDAYKVKRIAELIKAFNEQREEVIEDGKSDLWI